MGILHAMAYGLPAVLNDTHNSTEAEAFENGKCGLMFREYDTKSLAQTICRLLSDADELKKMGRYAQERVFERYTMDNMVSNYCAAIEDAASRASHATGVEIHEKA
jgi:glycosyltransferase involved in cell wall biosynthesis